MVWEPAAPAPSDDDRLVDRFTERAPERAARIRRTPVTAAQRATIEAALGGAEETPMPRRTIKNKAAVALGRRGGRARSDAKAAASRENGKKGGRPLRFGHWHVCPVCKVSRECPERVPRLECPHSDDCDAHTDPHTQAAIDAAQA